MEDKKRFLLRLEPELYMKLLDRAEVNGRSVNGEIVAILKSAIKAIPVIGKIENGVITIEEELARR